MIGQRFELGMIVITPHALALCNENEIFVNTYLLRHAKGDLGELDDQDWIENELSLLIGNRLFSSYELPKDLGNLWIITEADRSSTTILLPEDY